MVTPRDTLYAATRGGALSQGREHSGLVKEGFDADLVVLDISGVNMHPVHDLMNNLVYSADNGDVKMTMVDGRILYEDGAFTTIDVEKAIDGVERATGAVLSRLAEA